MPTRMSWGITDDTTSPIFLITILVVKIMLHVSEVLSNFFFLWVGRVWRDLQRCLPFQKICEQVFGKVLLLCTLQRMDIKMWFQGKIWFPFLISLVSIYKVDIGSTTFVQYCLLICRTEYLVADTTVWNFALQKKLLFWSWYLMLSE